MALLEMQAVTVPNANELEQEASVTF